MESSVLFPIHFLLSTDPHLQAECVLIDIGGFKNEAHKDMSFIQMYFSLSLNVQSNISARLIAFLLSNCALALKNKTSC